MANKRYNRPKLSESWGDIGYDNSSGISSSETDTFSEDPDMDESTELQSRRRNKRKIQTGLPSKNERLGASGRQLQLRREKKRLATRENHDYSDTGPELIMPSLSQNTDDFAESYLSPKQVRKRPARLSEASVIASAKSARRARKKVDTTDEDDAPSHAIWSSLASAIVNGIFPVVSGAMSILRPVLSLLLAATILAFIWSAMTRRIATSLSPCRIPVFATVASFLHLPMCDDDRAPAPAAFDELISVQSAFEDIMSISARSVTLPLEMKYSEASIRDLRTVVRYSALPSRNELVFEFDGFLETANKASRGLSQFDSRTARTIDYVLSINRWTLQVIDGISDREASSGSLGRLTNAINPFTSHSPEQDLLDRYLYHTHAIEGRIGELIIEAESFMGTLQNLDERLDVIAEIAARDGISTKGSRDELLATLWVKLGGKKATVEKLNDQLALLNQVNAYRKMAWAHVSGTVLKLRSIAAGLEDLRERVNAPQVIGERADVPLSVHIENIQLGLERLESQRRSTQKLQSDTYDQIVDRVRRGQEDRID